MISGNDAVTVAWAAGEIRTIALDRIGQRYGRYRLAVPTAEEAMARSLRRHGQLSPIVVCLREERPELIDGFKRLSAAQAIPGMRTLQARRLDTDERGAKAAMYTLNCMGRRPQELEEAWIVCALVREDGLSQVEVAELLGRHKSWVCRRLALVEKLHDEAREALRLGLLSPTAARHLTRLPAGNQPEVLTLARAESLTAAELRDVVDLLLASATRAHDEYILNDPREAIRQVRSVASASRDPRLSEAGNRIAQQLGRLRDQLGRMANWVRHRGATELTLRDRGPLTPEFSRLAREARAVASAVDDFLTELTST
jgi:ParB-like chromosome segregation protein Spo0J